MYMFRHFVSIAILILLVLSLSCSEEEVITDSRRSLIKWSPPEDFRPSYIVQDENGVYYGLFISKRYSGRYNLWGVSSRDGKRWLNPFMIDNAYYFGDLDFSVRNDSLFFIYYEIAPEYFGDHGLGLGDYVDYKDELELAYSLKALKHDWDHDNLPDNVEAELLISKRLPDTDLDGKPDGMDYNPLAIPQIKSGNYDLYEQVLWNIIRSAGLDTIPVKRDTAWSKFYGIYVLSEPAPIYVSFPREKQLFEMAGFPMPLISVKTPLWYGSRQRYNSSTGGTIPHINFKAVSHKLLKNKADVIVEVFRTEDNIENYRFVLEKTGDKWNVTSILLIEEALDSNQVEADSSKLQTP
jgi:hypothetical protein